MVRPAAASRKRVRNEGVEAPPFHRARVRTKLSHGNAGYEPGRLRSSSAVSTLALVAHARLAARDFGGAARALAVLLTRYRRASRSTWHFPREAVAVAGAVARKTGRGSNFLQFVAEDCAVGALSVPHAGTGHVRAIALVEAALDEMAAGRVEKAHDLLSNLGRDAEFENAFLVWLFLGLVALALAANGDDDRTTLLAEAGEALDKAAAIDPTAYICAHSAAVLEIERRGGDTAAGLDRYRAFAGGARHDAFAQAALLRALRALDRPPRQELVDAARALHAVDPIAPEALATLREAAAWDWHVNPRVDRLEVAAAAAAGVEHGGGDTKAWALLADCLRHCDENQRIAFWSGAGRDKWWPSHFFRLSRINTDSTMRGLATAKAEVAILLDANIPYARVVHPDPSNSGNC